MSASKIGKDGPTLIFKNMFDQGLIENPVTSFWYSRYICFYTYDQLSLKYRHIQSLFRNKMFALNFLP